MLNGNVLGSTRAITPDSPLGVTASTSPVPQLQSQTRPSCHRSDSGNPRPPSISGISTIFPMLTLEEPMHAVLVGKMAVRPQGHGFGTVAIEQKKGG